MPLQKPSQQKDAVNKEIEQMFVGMRMGSSVAFAKPRKGKRAVLFAILAAAVAGAGFGAWYFFLKVDTLARVLPPDTQFYAHVAVPREGMWYDQFFFWRSALYEGQRGARLYQKLNVVSWEGVQFATDILPAFAGSFELARLDSSTLIARATVRNPSTWFSAVGFEGAYDGVVQRFDAPLSGAWPVLAGSSDGFWWQMVGRALYVSNKPNFAEQFVSRGSLTLAPTLAAVGARQGVAALYVANRDVIGGSAGIELETALLALPEPFVFVVERSSDSQWVWRVSGTEKGQHPGSFGSTLPLDSGTGFLLRAADFGGAWNVWAPLYPPVAKFELLLKELYQMDISAFSGLTTGHEVLFAAEESAAKGELGPGWLFFIEYAEPNQEVGNALKNIGTAFFAVSHPLAVERTLSDGSTMVELRAETEGLAWQELGWMESLRGQGEDAGYFTGHIPGAGYVLASSFSLLERYLAIIKGFGVSDSENPSCVAPDPLRTGALLSFRAVFPETFFITIIDHVLIGESVRGSLVGCIGFR
ncbi:MAG: hypothetical protein HY462_00215 [Parcubacteria group bacterium]|nr:hypothetical protein [Parcubacteria group bacterium]